jgi:hypothetical protein
MAACTVSSYPGASAKPNRSWRAASAGNCQGRLRSTANTSHRPAPVAATGVAMGASSLASASAGQQGRRRMPSLQRGAQPVGGDGDDR